MPMPWIFDSISVARQVRAYSNKVTLWPRLASVVGLGFIILVVTFGFLSMRVVSDSTNRILQGRLVIAEMIAEEVDRLVARAFYELAKATDFAAFNPKAADLSAEERMLAHAYGRIGTLSLGVYFLDETGRLILSEPRGPGATKIDFPNRAEIREVLQTGKRGISAPFIEPNTGKVAVAVVVPIKDTQGRVMSLLSGFIDLDAPWVQEVIHKARKLGETGHAEIVDERGMVVATTEAQSYLGPGEHLGFYVRMGKERQPSVETVPYDVGNGDGNQDPKAMHVMAYAPLQVVPWGVAVGGDREETFAPIARLRNGIFLFGAFALAIVLFATLIGTRRLVKPVIALTASAQRISSGDLDSPIDTREGGEIGMLARTLEEMRVRLRESLEELTRWGTELEDGIRLRTAELERRNRELSITGAVATTLSQSLHPREAFDRVLGTLLDSLGLRFAEIYVLEDSTPVSKARKGDPDGLPKELQLVPEVGDNPWVITQGDRGASALTLGVPLLVNNRAIGVLVVQSSEGVTLGVSDFELLKFIGNQIGITLENARLLEEIGKLEAVRELDRLRSGFISSVSHELKTPLGFIKGYVTTLLRPDLVPAEETRREFLEIIREESEKLQELVDNLLDTARLQAGELGIEKKPVDIPAIARSVVERTKTMTLRHTFAVDFPPGFPIVRGDQRRLEQVLYNLIDNAIKYTPQGGLIKLRGEVQDDYATIILQDEGEGIPYEDLDRVFEPFYRVDSPLTHQVRGSGLGLAICRGIIEAHGGSIWAESTLGRGSTFFFTLPVPSADARAEVT